MRHSCYCCHRRRNCPRQKRLKHFSRENCKFCEFETNDNEFETQQKKWQHKNEGKCLLAKCRIIFTSKFTRTHRDQTIINITMSHLFCLFASRRYRQQHVKSDIMAHVSILFSRTRWIDDNIVTVNYGWKLLFVLTHLSFCRRKIFFVSPVVLWNRLIIVQMLCTDSACFPQQILRRNRCHVMQLKKHPQSQPPVKMKRHYKWVKRVE